MDDERFNAVKQYVLGGPIRQPSGRPITHEQRRALMCLIERVRLGMASTEENTRFAELAKSAESTLGRKKSA